jgi:hypothetical protein
MTAQFGRVMALVIGTAGGEARTTPGLRIAARVTYKSARAGEAELEVYNPAPATIAAAEERGAIIRLLAGYGVPELVFEGTAIRDGVMVRREGADRILSIVARTGGVQLEQARLSLSYAQGTRASDVLAEAARALGLPQGVVQLGQDFDLPAGFSYSGNAGELLQRIVQSAGSTLTVRDGVLQVLPEGGDTGEQVARLTPDTGLLGSPTRRKGKKRPLVELEAQLIPGLRPGKRVVVESESLSGVFVARDVSFELDLIGEFKVAFTARETLDTRST